MDAGACGATVAGSAAFFSEGQCLRGQQVRPLSPSQRLVAKTVVDMNRLEKKDEGLQAPAAKRTLHRTRVIAGGLPGAL